MEPVEITPSKTCIRNRSTHLKLALVVLFLLLASIAIAMTILYATYNDGICKTPACVHAASRMISSMDTSVEPCENFYQYSCGGWLKKNIIPEGSHQRSIVDILTEQQAATLKEILEKENDSDISAVKKIKIFYRSCVDEDTRNYRMGQPLIATLPDIFEWPAAVENWENNYGTWTAEKSMSHLTSKYAESSIISVSTGTSFINNSVHIIYIGQPQGRLLPAELYECSGVNKKLCSIYEKYMVYVVSLVRKERSLVVNEERIRADMKKVFEMEKRFANASFPHDVLKDPHAIYTKIPFSQMKTDYTVALGEKSLNWTSFINAAISPGGISIKDDEEVMLASDYITKIRYIAFTYNNRDIQNYLAWQYVKSVLDYLGGEYKNAAKLLNQVQYGSTVEPNIWEVCIDLLLEQFDDLIGRFYVEVAFSRESRKVVRNMIGDIRQTFLKMLEDQTWMDERTRKKASIKALKMQEKIGFPDDLFNNSKLDETYAGLEFKEHEYFENQLKYKEFSQMVTMQRLRSLTDPDEWTSGSAEINAEYVVYKNQIVFPAGILQPPYFSAQQPMALNYGGIGTVIGHEITHGFDETGKDHDENGNLVNWWTEESLEKFNNLSMCFEHQYGHFSWEAAGGKYLSGSGTLSENLADNGGLRGAYKAYEKYLKIHGKEQTLPGLDLTNKQLFFLAFGQIWCSVYTKEYSLLSILEDEHSPGEFRVIGTLQNFPEFSEVFSCGSNDYMKSENICLLW